MKRRQSLALLSEPADVSDLIKELSSRDYKVLACNRIVTKIRGKWYAEIDYMCRPNQILENEDIWIQGYEVSFLSAEDEATFLLQTPPLMSENSFRTMISSESWQPSESGLELEVINLCDAKDEFRNNLPVGSDSNSEADGHGSSVSLFDMEDSEKWQSLRRENKEYKEELVKLREAVSTMADQVRMRMNIPTRTANAYFPNVKQIQDQNRRLRERNAQLELHFSSTRSLKKDFSNLQLRYHELEIQNRVTTKHNLQLHCKNEKLVKRFVNLKNLVDWDVDSKITDPLERDFVNTNKR